MPPSQIAETERLGRGVFRSRDANRVRPRSRFYKDAFSAGPMSVDRLDYADIPKLREIHDDEAIRRPSVNNFYGWYAFHAELAFGLGMDVHFTPTEENPWHAEIVLPQDDRDDEDALLSYYVKLASESTWVGR